MPTKEQVKSLANFYKDQKNEVIIAWLSDKLYYEVQDEDLGEPFRTQALGLSNGQASAVFRSDAGVHVMVLCDRENTGSDIPTLEQLEDRLYDQELALIARRYLRDIRREAAIIQP